LEDNLAEEWDVKTHGFTRRKQRSNDTKSPGRTPSRSTLCLGGGWKWDPAEAARAAAEERAREAGEALHPTRARSKSTPRQRAPTQLTSRPTYGATFTNRVTDAGWLSDASRTNMPVKNARGPVMTETCPTILSLLERRGPMDGPTDVRALRQKRLGMGIPCTPVDPTDRLLTKSAASLQGSRTDHGTPRRSVTKSSKWNVDGDYDDKQPQDERPIMGARINGGLASPAQWDPLTFGFVGTDSMRVRPDSTGNGRAVGPGGTTAQGEAKERAEVE